MEKKFVSVVIAAITALCAGALADNISKGSGILVAAIIGAFFGKGLTIRSTK